MQATKPAVRSAVIILGMHRSGTSALTRLVNLCGWQAPKTLMQPSEANETGHWESIPIVRINNQILSAFDRQWADPKPIPEGWMASAEIARFRDAAFEAIAGEFGNADRIVIKDPRLSHLLPFWADVLDDMGVAIRVLIASRNPLEIVRSLRKRDGMKQNHGLLLWQSHMLSAEYHSRPFPRALIHYDDLLDDWLQSLSTAMSNAGEPIEIDDAVAARIADFLSPRHRHVRISSDVALESNDLATPFQNLYLALHNSSAEFAETDFDRLRLNWLTAWEKRSEGPGASQFAGELPVNFVQQSRKAAKTGRDGEAISLARKAIDADPDIARHHHYLGRLLVKAGMLDEATHAFFRAIALYPRSAEYHHDHADTLRRIGRIDEAIIAARGAIECNPDHAEYELHLGKLLSAQAHFEEAERSFSAALEHGGYSSQFVLPFAALLRRLGKLDQLEAMLHGYTDAEPADFIPHAEMAEILLALGRPGDAFEAQSEAASLASAEIGLDSVPDDATFLHDAVANAQGMKGAKRRDALLTALAWWRARGLAKAIGDDHSDNPDAIPGDGIWPSELRPSRLSIPQVPAVEPEHNRPLISVLIPVFNVAEPRWLRECLDSLLAEAAGTQDFEIVVVDDASKDRTAREVSTAYGSQISYVRNDENLGLLQNHNRCLELARGEFVHILHQDDLVYRGFYSAMIGPMQKDDSLVAAFARTRMIDGDGAFASEQPCIGRTAGPLEDFETMIAGRQLVLFPSIVVRRSAYREVGGFSPSSTFAFDWEMWSRIGTAGRVWFDPSILCAHRVHAKSATNSLDAVERLTDGIRIASENAIRTQSPDPMDILSVAINRLLAREWRAVIRQASARPEPEIEEKMWEILVGESCTQEFRAEFLALICDT